MMGVITAALLLGFSFGFIFGMVWVGYGTRKRS
jgi:hypothetical protein